MSKKSKSSKRKEPLIEEMILPGMIDSHFHTKMITERGLDSTEYLEDALAAGLAGGIDIGVTAGDTAERLWVRGLPQRASQPDENFPIHVAAGLAPAEAEYEDIDSRLELLEKDLEQYPVSALGEIGVDGYWNYGTPERQKELFASQIAMANRYRLPIIIHNRDADEALLEVLEEHRPEHGGIMHCFSSSYETARTCIDYGLLISFAGNLTFKKSNELREVARRIPTESILTETDSPFLSPEPFRGKTNHPAKVSYVYSTLAEAMYTELEKVIETVEDNFRRLFPL